MKPVISPEYAAMNRQLHDDKPEYGVGAAKDAASVVKLARSAGYTVVLDYGCGKGALKPAVLALAPELTVLEFDPAVPGKDALPTQAVHLVAALDVMEHIEPEYLDGVLQTMCDLKPHGVVLKIALIPANKTLPDGRNAHLIVEAADWWKARLEHFFKPFTTQDLKTHFLFYGTPFKV